MRAILVAIVFFSSLLHLQGAAEALEYRVLANHRVVPTVDVVHLDLSSTWTDCIAACEASRKYFFLHLFQAQNDFYFDSFSTMPLLHLGC